MSKPQVIIFSLKAALPPNFPFPVEATLVLLISQVLFLLSFFLKNKTGTWNNNPKTAKKINLFSEILLMFISHKIL